MLKITLNTLDAPYKNFQLAFITKKETLNEYCDLYYFCLDQIFLKNETEYVKGILNFVYLLENWKRKFRQLTKNNPIFLPFDFSDQYIGGLFVIEHTTVSIRYAFSRKFIGSMYSPTQIDLMSPTEDEITIVSDDIEINRVDFFDLMDKTIIDILDAVKIL